MARDATANCHRSLENESAPQTGGSFHFDRKLVYQRIERHHLAGSKISLEQVARIPAFRGRAEKGRREVRTCDQYSRRARARKIRTQSLAFGLTVADEHRLLALPRLHPAIERRVYSRERSVRPAQHRLVQRSERLLPRRGTAGHHPGNRIHEKL